MIAGRKVRGVITPAAAVPLGDLRRALVSGGDERSNALVNQTPHAIGRRRSPICRERAAPGSEDRRDAGRRRRSALARLAECTFFTIVGRSGRS